MTLESRWLEKGFDASTFKHRDVLTDIILSYNPKSVLDVGCASGPDLYLLKLKNPDLILEGTDLDGGDTDKAKEICATTCGDLREILPKIETKSIDVVFSNGVIMYVEPKWIDEMMRIAKKAVVLSERNPYHNFTLAEYTNRITKTTHITKEIRESWQHDGHIYQIDTKW